MRARILKFASLMIPVMLTSLAIWCLFSQDQHFPWIGSMIKEAERQQAKLKDKIQQQRQIMQEREPAALELARIRENSFSTADDIIGLLRSRVEQTLSSSGTRVRTIATPRKVKSASGLDLYEIALTAEAKTDELTTIMQEFSKQPVLLWRSLAIRPNNMRKPEFLNLNITIAVVGFPEKTSIPVEKDENHE